MQNKIISFLIIIMLIYVSGCLSNNNDNIPEYANIKVNYIVEVNNLTDSSEVIIPTIINLTLNLSNLYHNKFFYINLLNNISFINNTGSLSNNNSEYGYGIKINSSKSFIIVHNNTLKIKYGNPQYEDPHYILSLESNPDYENYQYSSDKYYYIYYSGYSIINFKLDFSFNKNVGRSGFYLNINMESNLTNGWNKIPGKISILFAD